MCQSGPARLAEFHTLASLARDGLMTGVCRVLLLGCATATAADAAAVSATDMSLLETVGQQVYLLQTEKRPVHTCTVLPVTSIVRIQVAASL